MGDAGAPTARARHVLTGRAASARPPRARRSPPRGAGWPPCGLEPGSTPDIPPLDTGELERRRAASGLGEFVPRLSQTLSSVIDAGQMVVVADADGRVLWRVGVERRTPPRRRPRLRRRLGVDRGQRRHQRDRHQPGARRGRAHPGAGALRGVAHPVGLRGGSAHGTRGRAGRWASSTSAARRAGMHPAELALVELAARLTSMELVERRRAELDRLRATAAPLLAGIRGDALAVDTDGHLAAAVGSRMPERVALPDGHLRWCRVAATPGCGVRRTAGRRLAAAPRRRPRRRAPRRSASTSPDRPVCASPVPAAPGRVGSRRGTPRSWRRWSRRAPTGARAAGLAEDLFDDRGRVVTVRAEMSRLRRAMGGVLLSGPYRVAPGVACAVALPEDRAAALPGSSAPVVQRLRRPPAMTSRGAAGPYW